jgi:hypothetical protein
MVTTVETLPLVVVVMMADSNSNGGQNRISGSSSGSSGYGGGRQQQKLWGQATINKMWQVVAVAAETGVMAVAITAAHLQRQAGVAA